MRITLLTAGSRGDVQPYVALGLGLERAGHTVTLAASLVFESFVRSYGLTFAPVRFNPQEFIKRPEVQKLFRNPNLIRLFRDWSSLLESLVEMFDDFWQASQNVDAIILSPAAHGGYDCAEKLDVPACMALLQPINPTGAVPNFFLSPRVRLGFLEGPYNRLTHLVFEQAFWQAIRGPLNRWRQNVLGLLPLPRFVTSYARMRAARVPFLFGYSPAIVPKPRDWADWHHVTGYWFLDAPPDWQPPPELIEFLEAGPPPVYIGFGSMSDEKPEILTRIALDALQMTGRRGILASGWIELGGVDLPDTVFRIGSIPHDWLFPQMAAIVHHGGAGTIAANLRSGVPSILTPFMGDQFAWGKIIADLGVGPPPIPIKKLAAARLAAAIEAAVTDPALRVRAAALGERIRAEDGVARAVEAFHQHIK